MPEASLPPGIQYFREFRDSKLAEYTDAFRELRVGGSSGYPRFEGSDVVIQTLHDIYGAITETLADFSVPKGFVTPEARIEMLMGYHRMLTERIARFEDIGQALIAEGKLRDGDDWAEADHLPHPYQAIYGILKEVVAALAHALKLEAGAERVTLPDAIDPPDTSAAPARIEAVFEGFHRFALQLQKRHEKRATLEFRDEYDVQDALHALLRMGFDDVRDEEATPSNAGASARLDFLLVAEEIAIEVKMVRKGLSSRVLGEQIAVDKQRHRAHPKAKSVYFFIYDPRHLLKNPAGFSQDLSEHDGKVGFRVIVIPKA